MPTVLWESLWNEGKSILGLYKTYYGMLKRGTKAEKGIGQHFFKKNRRVRIEVY